MSGPPTSEIMDRAYFHGIYLHDPDGHIVEIVTVAPGITADESEAELGRTVRFPPRPQPRRSEIQRSLMPISVRDPIGR
jgi:glyoxalase family protein